MEQTKTPRATVTITLPIDDRWEEQKMHRTLLADKAFDLISELQDNLRILRKHDDKIDDYADDKLEELQALIFESGLMEFYQ